MSLKNGFENFPSVKNIHDLPSVGDSNKRILVSSIAKLAIWNGSSYNYINPFTEQDGGSHIAALGGTMIGVVTGSMADIAAIALSTSNTYSDAAVNTAVNAVVTKANLELKELQTQLNALISSLQTAGLLKSS